MTDDEIRKLIRKSVVKTSDKFTDELMHKVELHSEKKINAHFVISVLACILLSVFIFKLSLDINILHIRLNLSPVVIRVLGSLFIFIMLNRLIILKSSQA